MSEVRVHVAPHGNAFMSDIAAWIVEAAGLLGRVATLIDDGSLPTDSSSTNLVVAPHEFYLLSHGDDRAIDRAARCSVPVCTEQPGTTWFEQTASLCEPSPLVFDINPRGVEALRDRGYDAHFLRLGGTPSMDRRADHPEKSTDVLFLGGHTPHRAARLAELAPELWAHATDLRLFSFTRPVTAGVDGLVFGTDKYDLLATTRIMLNIHRDERSGYFEWARMIEAMANGCAVLTEPSSGHAPLAAGEHFVVASDLPAALRWLLGDPDEVTRLGQRAADAVLRDFPLTTSLAPLLDRAEEAVATSPSSRRWRMPRHRARLRRAQQIPVLPVFQPNRELRREVHAAWAAEVELQRSLEEVAARRRFGVADHVVEAITPTHADADPEVSVVVTLFDYADVIVETLDSVVASRDVDMEIVIVDDHSRDEGRGVVRRWLDGHPEVPALLIGSDVNRGLPASRNKGFERARADKVMVMDADNLVYPTCLRRLADALQDHPDAAFAYASLEDFGATTGVHSAMGWHVPWLCESNYIDAQAMLRRATWERHGGYRTGDPRLVFGWEDWDLWLRLAMAGEYGVHVPQLLGRYRTQQTSMLTTTNLFGDLMIEHLRELYPSLPWPADVVH